PEGDIPYKMAELNEMREAILEVLNEIPTVNADAIFMHYFQHMSLTAIGQRQEITRPGAALRIQDGIAMIQELLGSNVALLLHDFGEFD
ncbi:hypothetical protein LCGC14_3139610, partial [marine sediment metagenome]